MRDTEPTSSVAVARTQANIALNQIICPTERGSAVSGSKAIASAGG